MTLTAHSRAESKPSSTDRKLLGALNTKAVPYMVITFRLNGLNSLMEAAYCAGFLLDPVGTVRVRYLPFILPDLVF